MINQIKETEKKYFECFCQAEKLDYVTRYSDDNISDMYSHNFTYVEDDISDDLLIELISKELAHRKALGKTYLKVLTHKTISDELLEKFLMRPQCEVYDYYATPTQNFINIKERSHTSVKQALSPLVVQHGKYIDVAANYKFMTMEFAIRRIDRKFMVYLDSNLPLNLYVAYEDSEPVGNCELLLSNSCAKIEDFDILDIYQKKGFGSHMLRKLLEICTQNKVEKAYLVTDSEDTAKDMYKKCGFTYAGQRTELMFYFR